MGDQLDDSAHWPSPDTEQDQAPDADVETAPGDDDGLFPAPVSVAPHTGDEAVDQALADLEQGARDDDLDAQVAAGERAHRELQARLDDLGTA
ncbi:hypothetical protein V3N99_18330 [Dermatophilaceae bacterium Soc4.6]